MRVLVACEWSGRVRDAFTARGWDAWSCDLLASATEGNHLQMDVREVFRLTRAGEYAPWDLSIIFPPCDHLSLAGARWWAAKQADGRQRAAADFFMEMIDAPASRVAVENPHGIMKKLYRPPDQVVEPWWFGDPFAKKICLWAKGLPPLRPDEPVTPTGRVATGGGSWRTDTAAGRSAMSAYEDSQGRANRARVRGMTFPGLARAMAAQWGEWIEYQAQRRPS